MGNGRGQLSDLRIKGFYGRRRTKRGLMGHATGGNGQTILHIGAK